MAMSLRGDLRESISLEDDEDSDVEDEVFIRDGKHGYKFAEEINMKRPLMAPRRRARGSARGAMGGVSLKFSENGDCKVTGWKVYWKPCCYVWGALVVLIGLIAVVVVLVSIYPLPLGSLGSWRNFSSSSGPKATKASDIIRARKRPCSDLRVTEVWTATLPDLDSDSSLRSLDVNGDGIGDIIFGFGTGDGTGGVSALDGKTGIYIWKKTLNDSIYSLQCNHDVTGDRLYDCLAVGEGGTVLVMDPTNGSIVWIRARKESDSAIARALYVANFIEDADGDGTPDVLATRSSLQGSSPSRLLMFSGKDGTVLGNIALAPGANNSSARSFYMPQVVRMDESTRGALLGTGVPGTKGELLVIPLEEVLGKKSEHFNTTKLYEGGAYVTPGVLADVTGDGVEDVAVVDFDARLSAVETTLGPKWNFTVFEGGESALPPCPAYFNGDRFADFLMTVKRKDEILNTTYTQAYIIDGKYGKLIYDTPTENVAYDQMAALSISSEEVGNDLYLYWISDPKCSSTESAPCRPSLRLTALGEFHQPPGIVLFDTSDFTPSAPPEAPPTAPPTTTNPSTTSRPPPSRYQWEEADVEGGDPLYVDYQSATNRGDDGEEEWGGANKRGRYSGRKRGGVEDEVRDPRGGLQPLFDIDDRENVEASRYRLMHDLERLPDEILQENLQRGRKKRRRRRRGKKEKDRAISLWDLESEREATEKKRGKQEENNEDFEGKRENPSTWGTYTDGGSFKVTSVGIILDPLPAPRKLVKRAAESKMAAASKILSKTTDSEKTKIATEKTTQLDEISAVDVVVAIHWLPDKMATEGELDNTGPRRGSLMFVRRMRVECVCAMPVTGPTNQIGGKFGARIFEKCATFLPEARQRWNQYLGRFGNGTFT